ncbi:AAA family ATPase [Bacillus gobiensis]|uniref:AAA family ATPase n=1 Tax=Bacillus gobiensis TaxID=1441095 RepID=UPI003D1CE76C
MTTALYFLSEWAGEESWKIQVLNKVKTKSDIDSAQLLEEVLQLIKSKEMLDKVPDLEWEHLDKTVLVIDEINAPQNINALSSEVRFSLGKNLNVFYGENGSGKSSYVRMFRKLADNYFTSERDLTIIPNVYVKESIDKPMLQTVEATYTLGDKKKREIVEINQQHPALCKINVFDSESVLPLINSDLTFSILPKGFENFQIISDMLDTFRNELSKTIEAVKVKQENIFADSSYNFIREDLEKIFKEVAVFKEIKVYLDSNYPRSDSYEKVIQEIELQIKELESSNPKDKIKILSTQITKLVSIKDSIQKLSALLSQENLEKVNELIMEFEQKVQEEREFNESFQRNVSFLEVVNNEWLIFVKAGKQYFDSINKTQVKLGEPCIFCSTPLNSTSVNMIESYIKHVSNSNKEKLSSIEKEILRHDVTNIVITLAEEEAALFESEKFIERIKSVIQLVNRNKEVFFSSIKAKKVIAETVILDVTDVVQEINQEIEVLSERIENLKKSNEETAEIIASRKALKETLQKNEKLHNSLESLAEWFQFQETIEEYKKAKRKFSTNTLTQKQAEAFKNIVQGEYLETFNRFAKELKVSNVNLRLVPKKGKTLRKKFVSSEEYKVSQIMSEGEQKAVAMVEFATDLTMRNDFNTILFDDPVTSLDYKRSEMIANLIYQLSLDRQVVVFTHNIMFYYYLYNASAKMKNKENKFFKVDEFDKMNKGIVSESFSGRLENLKEVMKKLTAQEQTINSKACFGDELEEALKKAYADIRTWCELIVEEGFFKSVIRRYEPNIMFTKVKTIKGDFVGELPAVSELFEKSCRWMTGHSQPTETQHIRATKEAFTDDIKYIHRIYDQYK